MPERRSAVALVLAALALALGGGGCGGGASPPPASGASSTGASGASSSGSRAPAKSEESAAADCLAIAQAKRAKRPSEPAKVTVRHVLVKFAGAKNAPAQITRAREAACLRAQEARKKLEGGASFADVVKEYSDEAGAATREGMVGAIQRADVAPSFADAAFELELGQVSHVVESPFGFHVIQRAE